MSAKYYTILTETGKSKVANAAALGRQIKLTHIVVGDGDGSEYDPVESQTDLKKENYRAPISHLGTDAQNPNWIVAEGLIPVDVGGWFVREVGIFDEDGDLFAIGKYPETYKPTLAEGTGRDLYIRFIMVVSNVDSIDIKIDPTVAIATREFVSELDRSSTKLSRMHENILMAASNRKKPNIKSIFDEKVSSCLSLPYRNVNPFEVGGSDIVLKNVKTFRGEKFNSFPCAYFEHQNTSGNSYSYRIDVTLHNGLTHDDVRVEFLAYDEFGSWFETVLFSRNGDSYSTTRVSSGVRQYFGFRVFYQSDVGYLSINDIVVSNGTISLIDFEEMKSEIVQSCFYSSGNASGPLLSQTFGLMKVSHVGVFSGKMPRVIWVSPDGDGFSDNAVNSFAKGGEGGLSVDKALNPQSALLWQRTLKANGFEAPLVILRAGEYDMVGNVSPLWFGHSSADGSMVACIDGEAVFKGANSALIGLNAVTTEEKDNWPSVYVSSVKFDEDVTKPVVCSGVNLFGFNIQTSYSAAEGFDMDDCDFTLQKCIAEHSVNDGFNHHGFGHGILIDCKGSNNLDDGFSPHDDCTYEVWGGEYLNNGKGSVIPAFGAQGFCIGVKSGGSTGESTRVQADNDGGFVALCRDSTKRPTVMYCIDCISDGDMIGYNSAGASSFLYALNCSSLNSKRSATANSSWETSSPGYLTLIGHSYSGNTVGDDIEDVSKFEKIAF